MTLNEWNEWKAAPQTKEWFSFLVRLREEAKENWAQSVYTGPLSEETIQRNSAALGQVDLLGRLLEAEFIEVEGGKSE